MVWKGPPIGLEYNDWPNSVNLLICAGPILISILIHPMRHYYERVSIFVDGNNMFYAQQKNGWFFDPKRVLQFFTQEPEVKLVNAFWYTGLKDSQDQRGFRDALIGLGYTVRTKILKEYYDDNSGRYSQKANLDIEIVIDMFNTVDQYDRVVLFSGDGDFERAIELLRSKNTHITVVSTDGMIARELRNATDQYIDLNDIRFSIEKFDA
jgi:uncharacterized LabA/DUF88 family protein